jgi:SecD/SecF fusion protein
MTDRRKNALVLLLVAGLVVLSVLVIAGVPGLVKAKKTRLGLDLKGGVELIYQAKPTAQSKVTPESLERAIEIMDKRVDQLGVAQPEIQRTGERELSVALPDVTNAQRAQEEVGKTAQLEFYDWEPNVIGPAGKTVIEEGKSLAEQTTITGGQNSGASTTGLPEYKAVLRAAKRAPIIRDSDTTLASGCTPAKNKATTGPEAECIYGQWYLLDTKHEKVLRGPEETEKNLYGDNQKYPKEAKLEVVHVNPGTVLAQARPVETTPGKVTDASPESWYVLNDDPVLRGSDIKNPQQSIEEQGSGQPTVTFDFTSSGGKTFEKVTREIAERGQNARTLGVSKEASLQHFAIVLDNQIITTPSIDYTKYPEGIDSTNGSEISGGFTLTSAQNLANELQSGALPLKLELISQSQVSATLGKTALNQGLIAGLVGFAVVCLFLMLFYRVLGAIAIGGLVIYGVYFFALVKLIPVTLTLPGIAGYILTIGIAADANIVIFERVKEEIRGGRSIMAGIANGYKLGFAAIIDANAVTFMTAFILFALATAEVKGFAFTLGLGTMASLFTAVLATQAALGAMGRSQLVSHRSALGAHQQRKGWTFDFMGASKWFFSLSGCILMIGALAIGGKGLNFGIDFKSGTRIQTAFVKHASESEIQEVLARQGFPDAQIQKFTNQSVGGKGFQISVKKLEPERLQKIKGALEAKFGNKNFSSTSIGPTFGKTVANSAVIAIIASLLVISAYIALRFEWKYAIPVLIALMHDLLITAGVYSLTGREVTSSTVAALLTILGYSLYDTIIVFDRVRENVPRMQRAAFSQIVNRSMSEVLTRSLATSFCTLLPVLALLLFGGDTLKDFAFALLVGIASGAYSSIFIASPVLTHWKERETVYSNRRARIVHELGAVPAYATIADGTASAGELGSKRVRPARKSSLAELNPDEPNVSKAEFDKMVREIEVDESSQRPPADPTADLTPEDLVLKEDPKRNEKPKRPRNRKHGRSR